MTQKKKAATGETAILHPGSGKNVLCFQLDRLVTREDHKKCVVDTLRKTIKKYGNYRVLMIYMPTFEGWEPGAAEQNLDIVLECMPFCERAAYVNPPKKKILQMKISEPLINFEIRYFEYGQLGEALKWIRQPGEK